MISSIHQYKEKEVTDAYKLNPVKENHSNVIKGVPNFSPSNSGFFTCLIAWFG
jgi:hypothetical protein